MPPGGVAVVMPPSQVVEEAVDQGVAVPGTASEPAVPRDPALARDFTLERYRYILQQINVVNEAVHRFLAIYQALATSLVAAGLALFVGYRQWGVSRLVARDGIIGLLVLTTFVAAFTIIFLVVGMLTWMDYRNEECDLTDEAVYPGFRARPRAVNARRWYELYIVVFIAMSVIVLWLCALLFVLPAM